MEEKNGLNFHSESLQIIIDKYIGEVNKYKGYEALLSEIFQRRAKEYDYSDAEMEEQIKRFTENVKSIVFIPESIYQPKGSSAHYHPAISKIGFRKEYFDDMRKASAENAKFDVGEYFYEVFTHEVYHAIAHKSENEIGLSQKKVFGIVDTTIDEAFTEVAAARTVYNRTEVDFEKQRRKVTGYQDVAFVPSLIANIIGESEKTVLKAGMDGSDALEKLILSKYPKTLHKDVKTAFSKFKFYLDAYYKHSNKPIEMISKRDKGIIEKSLIEMENVAEEMFLNNVKNDSRVCDTDFAAEVAFRAENIRNPFGRAINDLINNTIFDIENSNKISKETKPKRKSQIDLVLGIETAAYFRDDIIDEEALKEVDELAKNGTLLEQIDNINNKYGMRLLPILEQRKKVYLESNEVISLPRECKYKSMIQKDDFHDFNEWDNTFESIETMRVFGKKSKEFNLYKVAGVLAKGIKGAAKGIVGIFKRVLNRKDDETPKLPEGDTDDIDHGYKFDEEIKVDPSTIDFKPNNQTIDVKKINTRDNTRNEGR